MMAKTKRKEVLPDWRTQFHHRLREKSDKWPAGTWVLSEFRNTLTQLERMYDMRHPSAEEFAKRLLVDASQAIGACWDNPVQQADAEDRFEAVKLIIKTGSKATLYDQERGPTPERTLRVEVESPIVRLYNLDQITDEQLRAANRIAHIYSVIVAGMVFKARDIESFAPPVKGSGRKPASDMPEDMALWHALVFKPWTEELRSRQFWNCKRCGVWYPDAPPEKIVSKNRRRRPCVMPNCGGWVKLEPGCVDLVLDVVCDGRQFHPARKDYGMGPDRAIRAIRNGLDLFGVYARSFQRDEPPAVRTATG